MFTTLYVSQRMATLLVIQANWLLNAECLFISLMQQTGDNLKPQVSRVTFKLESIFRIYSASVPEYVFPTKQFSLHKDTKNTILTPVVSAKSSINRSRSNDLEQQGHPMVIPF